VQQAKKEFWKRWIEEAFPEMLKQRKWTRDKKDIRVGDIVLRKDETAAGQTYKYPRVSKVHVSTDGRIRSADIVYRLPGEAVYRTTTRPIHKLVMIVPVEEQAVVNGPKKETVRQEEPGATPTEDTEATEVRKKLQPKKKVQGKRVPTGKYKKVNSQKKPEKQTRAIAVTVPNKKEEIVSPVAEKRKRGRPRKTPGTEPLDPRKGSVPDPGKGVCANPAERSAILEEGGDQGPSLGSASVS
jgi:hypothetical protein